MLDQPVADRIHALVMLSPNFLPRGAGAECLTRPGGPLLARLIAGKTRCREPANESRARYWSTCYPTAATVEVMRLIEVTDSGDAKNHILAGDIMSPGTTQGIAEAIIEFVRRPAP